MSTSRSSRLFLAMSALIAIWLMATSSQGWPGILAYAAGAAPGWSAAELAHAVANNADNGDSDNGESDNGESDNDESDTNNANDNEDESGMPAPPPGPAGVAGGGPLPAQGAAVSTIDQVSQCLVSGDSLIYHEIDGGVAVKSYQDDLNVTLARVDQSTVTPAPSAVVGRFIFRLTASACGGAAYTVLPSEVNLAVTYSDAVTEGRDENRFRLMYYDGSSWAIAPKLFTDPANNHVSASVTTPGVYALVQQ
jgi:hypothetical protein